jgi:hypothetical protein
MIKRILASLALLGLTLLPRPALADPNYGNYTYANSTIVSGQGVTLLVANTNPSLRLYVAFCGWESAGTNTGATGQCQYGTGATCGTSTTSVPPVAVNIGGNSGNILPLISAAANTGTSTGVTPSFPGLPLPLGYSLCGNVPAGSPITGYWIVVYQIAP